jgi:phosphoribosylpyrophosphate synthetase
MNLLLVDDFVTKGRTILAAATVLNRAFPAAQIQAFAVVRTMGLVPEVEKIRWEIRAVGDDALRDP